LPDILGIIENIVVIISEHFTPGTATSIISSKYTYFFKILLKYDLCDIYMGCFCRV